MIIQVALLDRRGSIVSNSIDTSDERPVLKRAAETKNPDDIFAWISELGVTRKTSIYGDDDPRVVAEVVNTDDLCLLFDIRSMTWYYANNMHSGLLEDRL